MSRLKQKIAIYSSLIRGIGGGILIGVYLMIIPMNRFVVIWIGVVVGLVGHYIGLARKEKESVMKRNRENSTKSK